MEVKKISIEQDLPRSPTNQALQPPGNIITRPNVFNDFVWQDDIVNMVKTAITSAQKSDHTLGHMLFSGPSGHGKTTLAHIISSEMWVTIKAITWYAISKPSELISILNNLQSGDILFIDEIHRLKPTIEEVLYIAMEDRVIDFVMPEWWSMRLPINHFTLIWATTKMESLAAPLKNRFIYKFHFSDYTKDEIVDIVLHYCLQYGITIDADVSLQLSKKVEHTPREIHNMCVKLRDYLRAHETGNLTMIASQRDKFSQRLQVEEWWITTMHRRYLDILATNTDPVGVKTIAAKLGMHEKAIEEDIEPLLLKLGKIEKTTRWRVIKE
jgi:holliday junction DNA helicase RuvB